MQVAKKNTPKELGLVGEMTGIDLAKLKKTLEGAIPVIVPIGVSEEGSFYNVNADDVACYLAAQLKAEKLILLTRVLGVMRNLQDETTLLPTILVKEAEDLIKDKVIVEGVVPKVRAAVKAVQAGVSKAHIVDAKIPHGILLEIFTDEGIGTEIVE